MWKRCAALSSEAMSIQEEAASPECVRADDAFSLRIETKPRDVGGFEVRRALPSRQCRSIGPFVFFDEMGPATFPDGVGIDVRPHPHINLATITYLFEGAIDHRDSLGTFQTIRPGAINLMVAGRGIVHSERSPAAQRAGSSRLHGIQLWIALPEASEEVEPAFFHHPVDRLPRVDVNGVSIGVLVGDAYDVQSPVQTYSPMLYLDVVMPAGTQWTPPAGHTERAVYHVAGRVDGAGVAYDEPQMLVLKRDATATLKAERDSRLIFLAGEPLGRRFMFWNFVSSQAQRIEEAKKAWQARRFDVVPGDEEEFIPLPE